MPATRSSLLVLGLMGATLMGVGAPLPRARACSGGFCSPARLFPGPTRMPRNQLRWTYMFPADGLNRDDGGLGHPTLYRVVGPSRERVPLRVEFALPMLRYTLEPEIELAEGTELVLTADAPSCDADAGVEAAFEVTAATAVPETLGTLQVTSAQGSIQVLTRGGSCSLMIEAAYVDLVLEPSEGARALDSVIDYQLIVDGNPYEFSTSLFGGRDSLRPSDERVFAPCTPTAHTDGVAEGMHTAFMRATLPRGESFQTPDVSFELRCRTPSTPPNDTGTDAGVPLDGSSEDLDEPVSGSHASEGATDAGSTFDASDADPSPQQEETSRSDDESSGCSAHSSANSRPVWWMSSMVALSCLALRRRRRRG